MSLKCHFLNRIQYRSCYLYSLSSITVHHQQLVIFGQRCVYWPYVGAATVSVSQYKLMGQSFLSPLTTLPLACPGTTVSSCLFLLVLGEFTESATQYVILPKICVSFLTLRLTKQKTKTYNYTSIPKQYIKLTYIIILIREITPATGASDICQFVRFRETLMLGFK